MDYKQKIIELMLQSTSLLRGKTCIFGWAVLLWLSFNPLPSCEGRQDKAEEDALNYELQSTSLLRGKTQIFLQICHKIIASIHFPLAREDDMVSGSVTFEGGFNPLPSCEGRHVMEYMGFYEEGLQSTSLLRGKTGWV